MERNDFLIKAPWIFRVGDRKSVNEHDVRKLWIYGEYSATVFHFEFIFSIRGIRWVIKKSL